MRRREFIGTLGGAALAWHTPAHAQPAVRVARLGVLMAGAESARDNQKRLAAFRQGLASFGWNEGQNIRIEYRWSTGKSELISQYAEELVALAPDVILANSTPVVSAFAKLTKTIPVVFALDMDPVGLGHVKSLAHPGGNCTGFTFIDPGLIGKWLTLLTEIVPGIAQAAIVFDPATTPVYARFIRDAQAAFPSAKAKLAAMPVGSIAALDTAIDALAAVPGSSLMIGPDPFNQVQLPHIAEQTMQRRLPTVSVYRPFVTAGGLMAYGPDTADVFRRSADYVNRILNGAKPGELPVQEPDKFEFIINLKTAKALGLTVPQLLLAQADKVIE